MTEPGGFPLISVQALRRPRLGPLGQLRRSPAEFPRRLPGTAYVFSVGGWYRQVPSLIHPDVLQATHVAVVDLQVRALDLALSMRSAEPGRDFDLRATFHLQVRDPVVVANDGLNPSLLAQNLGSHLTRYPQLNHLAADLAPGHIAQARRIAAHHLALFWQMNPPEIRGMTVRFAGVEEGASASQRRGRLLYAVDVRSSDRAMEPESAPARLWLPEIDVLSVVVLGPIGSGKTALLAMMHDELCADPSGLRGYFLESTTDTTRLRTIASLIREPGNRWPGPTGSPGHYEFNVFASYLGRHVNILKIRYADYPGEIISHPDRFPEEDRQEFNKLRARADLFLVVIDGSRIVEHLRELTRSVEFATGEASSDVVELRERFYRRHIEPSIDAVPEDRSDVVLHVILTKWDHVVHAGVSLDAVRTELMEMAGFRAKVSRRVDPDRPADRVRLIPVSVVGRGVIRDYTEMPPVKKERVTRPTNVDVIFATVLPDALRLLRETFDKRWLKRQRWSLRRRRVSVVAGKVLPNEIGVSFNIEPVRFWIKWRLPYLEQSHRQQLDDAFTHPHPRELRRLAGITERLYAMIVAVTERRMYQFESEHPAGLLAARRHRD